MSAIPRTTRAILTLVLVGLVLTAATLPPRDAPPAVRSVLGVLVWDTFLYGLPLVLAVCLLFGVRWALMLSVMYGTLGLALDLSTLIQTWDRPEATLLRLLSSTSGIFNAILVVIAGAAFLDVRPDGSGVLDQR